MTMTPRVAHYVSQIPATVEITDTVSVETVLGHLASLGQRIPSAELESGLRVSLVHFALPSTSRVRAIRAVLEDLALRLEVHSVRLRTNVRKGKVTLEIAHEAPADMAVSLGDIIGGAADVEGFLLPWAIGLTADGASLLVDVSEAPHVLIGGQTGSGKSSHLQSLVLSLAVGTTPEECELCFVDPKRVDLYPFRHLPQVRRPVATSIADTAALLTYLEEEIAFRFEELQRAGAGDIGDYNGWALVTPGEAVLSRIVVVIDELASVVAGKEGAVIGERLTALAQISRAAGVHLVCATQRPSAAALPTQLRSQLTTRVACRMATAADSRMVLGQPGAETLLGAGDSLVQWGGAEAERLQGTYIDTRWREWLTEAVRFAWAQEEEG
jgi:S-DNA-T family DNA segregation ATPase FtsK/SpoIIIE